MINIIFDGSATYKVDKAPRHLPFVEFKQFETTKGYGIPCSTELQEEQWITYKEQKLLKMVGR